ASSPLAAKVYDHTGAELAEGVTWASSDTAVAKVDSTTGVVTGVTLGTATITATSTVKPQRTASITVSVGALWTGTASSDWSSAANWLGGVVADSTRDATIPASSPNTPKLTVNGSVLTLVANGPVNLGGFTLQVHGALEGTGTISNGNLWYRGSELQGNTPSLLITSGVSLHGPTKATGPVSIQNGSLEISGAPLSISIP
ncbi:MAG TPA: Ig-like domain-containing protein, partial [Longimicrobium sp.]